MRTRANPGGTMARPSRIATIKSARGSLTTESLL
jgi:hypothetical protein